MTTLDTKADTNDAIDQKTKSGSAPTPAVEQSADSAALITEQQVLFASAAALAPAPARHRTVAHQFAWAVRAMFVRPEKPHARKHYPQRFGYLENSAMSRAMDRL
jgi:hypothetical protein